jgi:small-conductance mechanosensitive channel
VQLLGIRLVGVNLQNGKKLLVSVLLIVFAALLSSALRWIAGKWSDKKNERRVFLVRQGISISVSLIVVIGLISIWFDDPTRFTTFAGLFSAGVAFALQRVITALAGYLVILRGKTFHVGDRITMAGVRGDVIDLRFLQTVVMEMGQPPEVQPSDPEMWVQARQYSGRIVSISNDKIFDEPVYNYTREFPFIWDELHVPISYKDDRRKAEQILLDAARAHTVGIAQIGEEALCELERRYFIKRAELDPRVFFRLTDNWIQMSVRFVAREHGVRELKDQMSREIIDNLDRAGIGIASGTYEVVGLPPVKVEMANKEEPAWRH